jgi:hypothetical protein
MSCIVLKEQLLFFKWSVVGRRQALPYPGYANNSAINFHLHLIASSIETISMTINFLKSTRTYIICFFYINPKVPGICFG